MKKLFLPLLCALMLLGGCAEQLGTPAASSEPEHTYQEELPELTPLAVNATFTTEDNGLTYENTVLGTAEDYERIREVMTALAPESLSHFTCWSNVGYEGTLPLTDGQSRIIYDTALRLTACVKDEWSNPPTGGGWNVVLGSGDTQLLISFNGEWLCYGLDDTFYIFNAENVNVGYALQTTIGLPSEIQFSLDGGYPLIQYTLSDYLPLDIENVESVEYKRSCFGPAVTTGKLLTGEDAQNAVRELGSTVVTSECEGLGGGGDRYYVIRYTDDRTPLVLYECGTFHYGNARNNFFCSIDLEYYASQSSETNMEPSYLITIPESAETVYYDTHEGA